MNKIGILPVPESESGRIGRDQGGPRPIVLSQRSGIWNLNSETSWTYSKGCMLWSSKLSCLKQMIARSCWGITSRDKNMTATLKNLLVVQMKAIVERRFRLWSETAGFEHQTDDCGEPQPRSPLLPTSVSSFKATLVRSPLINRPWSTQVGTILVESRFRVWSLPPSFVSSISSSCGAAWSRGLVWRRSTTCIF